MKSKDLPNWVSIDIAIVRKRGVIGWLLLSAAVVLVGCQGSCASEYHYALPKETGDGWKVASLIDEKVYGGLMRELFNRIGDNTYTNIHAGAI